MAQTEQMLSFASIYVRLYASKKWCKASLPYTTVLFSNNIH